MLVLVVWIGMVLVVALGARSIGKSCGRVNHETHNDIFVSCRTVD